MDGVSLVDSLHRTKGLGVPVLHSDQDRECLHQVYSVPDRLCPHLLVRARLHLNNHSALGRSFPVVLASSEGQGLRLVT